MKKILINPFFGLFLLLATTAELSHASELPRWQMLPQESQLSFTATQNNAPVTGQFKTFTAAIFFDLNKLKDSHVDIVIDMNSLEVSYPSLKTTLAEPEWFDIKLFPKAEFKATRFANVGPNSYTAMGTLRIRDKTIPTTLRFTATQPSLDKAIVEGQTVIKRSAFRIGQGEWANTDEIKDDVTVHFKLSAIKQ